MDDGKLDPSETPTERCQIQEGIGLSIANSYLNSAASSFIGTPVCIVCMRKT